MYTAPQMFIYKRIIIIIHDGKLDDGEITTCMCLMDDIVECWDLVEDDLHLF